MKAVLMSVQPKWCEKIASGEKTIEVRKTRPKVETPFKCYIYCTKAKNKNEEFWIVEPDFVYYANGGVIGEFVCRGMMRPYSNLSLMAKQSCLTIDELNTCSNGKELYGWRIADLKVYDKPRELSEFRTLSMCSQAKYIESDNKWYCTEEHEECACFDYVQVDSGSRGVEDFAYCLCKGHIPLTRPPQSWCYVEELED